MKKIVLVISFLFVYFLIPEIFAQDSVQEAQADVAYLNAMTSSEKSVFYTRVVDLLVNLEQKNCELNEDEKEAVTNNLNRIVFENSGASADQKADAIMRALQDDLNRKGCQIDPKDPEIQNFLRSSEDLIQRIHTLAGALHQDTDS